MTSVHRSSTYKAEGVILSRRDLGDADRVITVFTQQFGRRRLVARGSRRPASQFAPHIELFTRTSLVGVAGSNLDVLTQAKTIETYPRLRRDLAAFAAAGWSIELLDGLSVDSESMPDAYTALVAFLRLINSSNNDPEPLITALALNLLDLHGYTPELAVCTVCTRHIEQGNHAFAPYNGGVVCITCGQNHATQALEVDTLKTLRFIAREGLAGAARLRTNQQTRLELHATLRGYANAVIEREISSAQILELASRTNSGAVGQTFT